MTVETATDFTISNTVDQEFVTDLEATFDGFRGRIAMMSIEACGVLTSMFTPLGPVLDEVIDIDAIEWEQLELEVTAADSPVAVELMVAA